MLENLPPRKAAFVRAYLDNLDSGNVGRGSTVDAVQAAGISPDNRNAARVRAYELMRDTDVLSALHNEQIRKLNAGSSLGVAVLIDLARTAKSETVRFQAAAQLVDRSPLGPVPSRSMNVHANVSIEELLAQLDAPGGQGAQPCGVIEAEYDDVTPDSIGGEAGAAVDPEFRQVDPIRQRWAAQAQQAIQEEPPEV
jgi:hypothetical protein